MTFDLEKARAEIRHFSAENPGEILEKLVAQANLAEEMLAEIERLQEESEQLVALNTDHECPNAFDDWGNPIHILVSGHAGAGGQPLQEAGQAARIKDLEEALVEERARAMWLVGDDPCDPPTLDWRNEPNDIPESVRLLWDKSAREQLQAEGKIGPDAKLRSWQITEDRKETLRRALEEYKIFPNDQAVLRAMLREAGQ